jgi:hypothetical protein
MCTNDIARNDLGSQEQLVPGHEATYEPVKLISQTVLKET